MRHTRLTAPAGLPPLVAVAHGSRDPAAAVTVSRLADRVRQQAARHGLGGLEVAVSYLGHALPTPGQVLGTLPAGPVIVLPLLLTPAYHSKTDIPALLAAARPRRGRPAIIYGETLGPDPMLLAALERRLAEAGVRPGDAGTSVVLAAAGSSDPAASSLIEALAARWRSLRGWRDVVPAYASAAEPSPGRAVAALRAAGAERVAVASYLLAPGRFAGQVAAEALAAGASAVSGVLGDAPEIAAIVLARYRAALEGASLDGASRAAARIP